MAFRGSTLEPQTRVALKELTQEVAIEVLTSADDESGAIVAKNAFGMAVDSPFVRTYLIMADVFPEALVRYSAQGVPHTVVNNQVHADGPLGEADLLKLIATAASSK